MRKFQRMGWLAAVALTVFHAPGSAWSKDDDKSGVRDIEVGAKLPSLIEGSATRFEGNVGAELRIHFAPPIGKNLPYEVFVAAQYQPFDVRSLSGVSLEFANFLVGVKTSAGEGILGVTPTLSLGVGGAVGWLDFTSSGNVTQNRSEYFIAQAAPGFDFPIWRRLSGSFRLPVTVVASDPSLTYLDSTLSLKWSFD